MSPFAEVALVARRELRKSFRSAKGIILTVLAIAGGAGVSMIFTWLDRQRAVHLPPGLELRDVQERAFTQLYGEEIGHRLADCPYPLWITLMASLGVAPLLVALLDFDAVSGDLQHRTVRYWTVRSRRSSYMIGKYLGAWLSVLAVTLIMNVVVWLTVTGSGGQPASAVLAWGPLFFAISIPISAAWCGIATLVASQSKSPMLSLLFIFATFFGLWILRVAAGVTEHAWLAYLYPNTYDEFLLSAEPSVFGRGLLGTAIIAVGTVAAATVLFERRDV